MEEYQYFILDGIIYRQKSASGNDVHYPEPIMDKEKIKSKLNEQKLINIIEEIIFTTSKFSDVLTICLFNDFNKIFMNIKLLEAIFGGISIVLEIAFFIISLLLIIYPIRSIDIIINWFSKRYNK